jgi:NAD(P)-dependent dehydrogenase (short-subunit alcohol dehydrogenase family)
MSNKQQRTNTPNKQENPIMSEDTKNPDTTGLDRREFLMAGAAGLTAAGLGAAGLGMNTAEAKTVVPGEKPKTNATKGGKRVVLINDALLQLGPAIAIELAQNGHNLVIAQPAKGLVDELKSQGAEVVVVEGIEQEGPNDESQPGSTQKLVDAAMKKFGGFDAAYIRTAIHHKGDILETTREDMQKIYESNFFAVMDSLQSLMPPLMDAGSGQILVLTSATATKPYYDMMGYSAMRAGANMMIRCAAMTGAPKGVVVNAIGSNFMNYPDAVKTLGGPDKMAAISKKIPVGRFGETSEVAHTAVSLLDGRNMFATGMFIAMAGGYNIMSDSAASMAEEC